MHPLVEPELQIIVEFVDYITYGNQERVAVMLGFFSKMFHSGVALLLDGDFRTKLMAMISTIKVQMLKLIQL